MPKQKTKRAAMKRFTRTGSGKLKRFHANHSHILTKKTRKPKNRLKKGDIVSSADFPRVNRLLRASGAIHATRHVACRPPRPQEEDHGGCQGCPGRPEQAVQGREG